MKFNRQILRSVFLVSMLTLLCGCQPDPPTESDLMSSLPSSMPIYINHREHIVSTTNVSIGSCSVKDQGADVDLSYEMTDGIYSLIIEGNFHCAYSDNQWYIEYVNEEPASYICYVGDAFPEELASTLTDWENIWSDNYVERTNWTKVSDNEIDVTYSISSGHEYKSTSGTSSLVCSLTYSTDARSTVLVGRLPGLSGKVPEGSETIYFSWYFNEIENTVGEQWNVNGTYSVEYTDWGKDRSVVFQIDSFDPETGNLHLAYAKAVVNWTSGPETYEVSDVTIQMKDKDYYYTGQIRYSDGFDADLELYEDRIVYDGYHRVTKN